MRTFQEKKLLMLKKQDTVEAEDMAWQVRILIGKLKEPSSSLQ